MEKVKMDDCEDCKHCYFENGVMLCKKSRCVLDNGFANNTTED